MTLASLIVAQTFAAAESNSIAAEIIIRYSNLREVIFSYGGTAHVTRTAGLDDLPAAAKQSIENMHYVKNTFVYDEGKYRIELEYGSNRESPLSSSVTTFDGTLVKSYIPQLKRLTIDDNIDEHGVSQFPLTAESSHRTWGTAIDFAMIGSNRLTTNIGYQDVVALLSGNNLVQMETGSGSKEIGFLIGDGGTTELWFDPDRGYAVTKLSIRHADGTLRYKVFNEEFMESRELPGVYLPTRTLVEHYTANPVIGLVAGELNMVERYVFSDVRINYHFPNDTFTIDTDFPKGTLVDNKISGTLQPFASTPFVEDALDSILEDASLLASVGADPESEQAHGTEKRRCLYPWSKLLVRQKTVR